MVPIFTKQLSTEEISKINFKNPLTYCYFGGIEVILYAHFREGIDTPIELYLADDRITYPTEKAMLVKLTANLIYQKRKNFYLHLTLI